LLGGATLDFLFIDGDHTYRGVQADFEMYSPLVDRNGLVAFHDIVVVPPHIEVGVDVHTFWQRVRQHYRWQELIENPAQGWGGIGVIQRRPSGARWGIGTGPPPPPPPPPPAAPPPPPAPPVPPERPAAGGRSRTRFSRGLPPPPMPGSGGRRRGPLAGPAAVARRRGRVAGLGGGRRWRRTRPGSARRRRGPAARPRTAGWAGRL